MKNIKDFILESKSFWNCKYISENDIIKLAKKAINQSKVKPEDIQNEFGKYKDPDDLFKAYDNNELENYAEFENAMRNLLEANSKYKGVTDNIMDCVFNYAYDIMENI